MRLYKSVLLAAISLALAGFAAEAQAQRTGTRMGRNATNTERDAAAIVVIIANCLAQRRPALVRRWFNLLPGSAEEMALLDSQEGDFGVCINDDQLILGEGRLLTYSARRLRIPAALAMAQRALSRAPATSPVPAGTEPWFVAALNSLPPGATVDRGSLLAQEFGHCLAVTNWAAARELIGARPGSSDETRAFQALTPILGSCLPRGLSLEINPKSLREYLAEPFVHLLVAVPAPSGG